MDTEIKKRSVTANDAGEFRSGGSVLQLILNQAYTGIAGLPEWWCMARDQQLRATIYRETLWSSAVSIAISKLSSLKWEVEGDKPRVAAYAQDLFLNADAGAGWVSFISRQLQDYFLCDNGQFTEIVRASGAAGSRILGIMHLDSLRCTRTGDTNLPVIYRDTVGVEHEMKAHQVFAISDMPSSSETWHGVGMCAASRAWNTIIKMQAIEQYIYDKISGRRALALDIVKGVNEKSIKNAFDSAKEMREAQSNLGAAYSFMGATLMPILDDTPLEHVRINFAELPDGFDREKEFNIGVLQYADALGIDPQDLQPLTGRALGSGEQSTILDDKAKGRNLMTWRQGWTHNVNMNLLSDTVTFAFSERDIRDQKQRADVEKIHVDIATQRITAGISTPQQEAQILADNDEFPREFVPQDVTPQETLADDAKPEQDQAAQDQASETEPVMPAQKAASALQFYAALHEFRALKEGKESNQGEVIKTLLDLTREAIAQKQTAPPSFHADIPVNVSIPTPVVNVTMPEQKAHVVNVSTPEQPAPVVNLTFDTDKLADAVRSTKDAVPNITVNVPEQPAPIINVQVPQQPAPIVTVQMPAESPKKIDVVRDRYGNITGLAESEKHAD